MPAAKPADLEALEAQRQRHRERAGLDSDAQWLLFVPNGWRDLSAPVRRFRDLRVGTGAYVQARLLRAAGFDRSNHPVAPARHGRGRPPFRLVLELADEDSARIRATVFGSTWAWTQFTPGAEVHFLAQVEEFAGQVRLESPELVNPAFAGRVVPSYGAIRSRVPGESLGGYVRAALPDYLDAAAELVDHAVGGQPALQAATGFATGRALLVALHAPSSVAEGERALAAARKCAALAVVRGAAERRAAIRPHLRSALPIDAAVLAELVGRARFELTADQTRAISEIVADLRSGRPMNRLLTGDVGCGKTLAFLLPAIATVKAGRCACIVTPNVLLVEQLCTEMARSFPEVPLLAVTGAGIVGAARPERALAVGTTALASYFGRQGLQPDLLIVDEQQKFSSTQRQALRGEHTNYLEATATPIPRTAALISHGGMDVSAIRQQPVAKRFVTSLVGERDWTRVSNHLLTLVHRERRQIAIVYPLVEDDPGSAEDSVERAALKWERHAPGRVAMLHGRMPSEEKVSVLRAFLAGERRLLVTSSVVEIGVTLPDLVAIMVISPERYGVSQLQQLRGRVARVGGTGYCYLYHTGPLEAEQRARLQLFCETTDGFELAERDAELRGYGDILGNGRQSGDTRSLFLNVALRPAELSGAQRHDDRPAVAAASPPAREALAA